MSKSKNYLRLGIVLAAFATVISLMCVAFSYADVNELTGTNNAEGNQVEAVVGGEQQEATVTNDEYTLTVYLGDQDGNPLKSGIAVTYCDMEDNVIKTANTNNESNAIFSLTDKQLNGKIISYTPAGLDDAFDYVEESYFKDFSYKRPFWLRPSNVSITSDDGLDSFNVHMWSLDTKTAQPIDQNYVLQNFKSSMAFLKDIDADMKCTAEIDDQWAIKISCYSPKYKMEVAKYDFTPNFKEGYTFDHAEADGKVVEIGTPVPIDPLVGIKAVIYTKADTPVEPTSAVLYGEVVTEEDGDPISGAIVKFANEATGEVFATTTTGENGSYVMNDISVDIVKQIIDEKLEDACVYVSTPGYGFDASYPGTGSWAIEDDKYVCEESFYLEVADIDIVGSEHHKDFILKMDRIDEAGVVERSAIYEIESIGLVNGWQIPPDGLSFDIVEGGIFKGEVEDPLSNVAKKTAYTITPQAEDGYVFDNLIVNNERFTIGDSVTFDGESAYDVQVNYKPVESESGLAQTGDAIPFAVLIALGIIAGLSVVAIRKFSK